MNLEPAILAHAAQCGENECCGLVVQTEHGVKYFPCRNISSQPTESFEIHPDDWIDAESQGTLIALVHSHPDGLPILSELDQQFQQKTQLDWWLVHHNQIYRFRNMPALLGRHFEHGVTDCYTLFRDVYHLCGIDLPWFPHEDEWWQNGKNYYLDNMSGHGFYEVDEVQEGDVLLICLGSSTPNHAAIYVGDQMIFHHCPHRQSKRDVYNGFWLKYTHSIWRYTQWQPNKFTAILNHFAMNDAVN